MAPAALETIPLFARLPAAQRDQLADVCTEIHVDAGGTIVQEGDFGFSMFGILEGTADVTLDGRHLRTLEPGDVFGEIAVLSGGRRTATVVAVTPMTLLAVVNRDVWRVERDVPDVGAALRQTIAACLQ